MAKVRAKTGPKKTTALKTKAKPAAGKKTTAKRTKPIAQAKARPSRKKT